MLKILISGYIWDKNLGGGHVYAGGINTSTEQDMNNAIDFIENDLYNKLPLIRKQGLMSGFKNIYYDKFTNKLTIWEIDENGKNYS